MFAARQENNIRKLVDMFAEDMSMSKNTVSSPVQYRDSLKMNLLAIHASLLIKCSQSLKMNQTMMTKINQTAANHFISHLINMKVFLMLDISLFSIKESCIIILNRRL
jgi:hypothetical protein